MTNIQNTLDSAAKKLARISDSAWLDAEVLLSHTLCKPRSHLRAWPDKQLLPEQYQQFSQYLEQRYLGTPIAYITGNREFWSRDFKVSGDVLIPRPDTELLVELSLKLLENPNQRSIIDLGTGSGIIAITLAAESPELTVTATDISSKALDIARMNADRHAKDNVTFIESHWFDKISAAKFDLVISNPPYIDHKDPHLNQGDVRFEPDSALVASDNGLQDIETIAKQALNYLKPKGTLLIEHGYNQQTAVQNIFKSHAYNNITTHTDLSGNPRVTTGQWKTP